MTTVLIIAAVLAAAFGGKALLARRRQSVGPVIGTAYRAERTAHILAHYGMSRSAHERLMRAYAELRSAERVVRTVEAEHSDRLNAGLVSPIDLQRMEAKLATYRMTVALAERQVTYLIKEPRSLTSPLWDYLEKEYAHRFPQEAEADLLPVQLAGAQAQPVATQPAQPPAQPAPAPAASAPAVPLTEEEQLAQDIAEAEQALQDLQTQGVSILDPQVMQAMQDLSALRARLQALQTPAPAKPSRKRGSRKAAPATPPTP